MADGNSEPEGRNLGVEGTANAGESSGPGSFSTEGPTFNFADGFAGSGSQQNSGNGSATNGATASAPFAKKRRGRQPYPRDAAGNIIRPASANGTTQDKGGKDRLAVEKKVYNDRASMKAQIDTFFKLAAQFTHMPHWMLSEQEAALEAEATCKLADSMGWDLSVGDSPLGAAVIFAVTTFTIIKPRIDETVRIANAVNVTPSAPASSGEARQQAQTRRANGTGGIDFSADINAAVNQGETLQ